MDYNEALELILQRLTQLGRLGPAVDKLGKRLDRIEANQQVLISMAKETNKETVFQRLFGPALDAVPRGGPGI